MELIAADVRRRRVGHIELPTPVLHLRRDVVLGTDGRVERWLPDVGRPVGLTLRHALVLKGPGDVVPLFERGASVPALRSLSFVPGPDADRYELVIAVQREGRIDPLYSRSFPVVRDDGRARIDVRIGIDGNGFAHVRLLNAKGQDASLKPFEVPTSRALAFFGPTAVNIAPTSRGFRWPASFVSSEGRTTQPVVMVMSDGEQQVVLPADAPMPSLTAFQIETLRGPQSDLAFELYLGAPDTPGARNLGLFVYDVPGRKTVPALWLDLIAEREGLEISASDPESGREVRHGRARP